MSQLTPRNVKAKEPETPLDSTMVEVEGKENNVRLSLLPQCPLPSAVYKVRPDHWTGLDCSQHFVCRPAL